jgi:hypothetical protein
MRKCFVSNIGSAGRWLRGMGGVALLAGAWLVHQDWPWAALLLALSGISGIAAGFFGWCALRALGIRTPL